MTREEAITALGDRNNLLWGMSKEEQKYYSEALAMAISALSENEGDLISRQAVLELVANYDLSMGQVVKGIHALPSVENKAEWIPVSERLPEEREWYLAVFKEKDTDFQLIPRVADYIGCGENKWRLIDEEGMMQEYFDLLECVAWMPLPGPYQKGGE